jgi:fructokinase
VVGQTKVLVNFKVVGIGEVLWDLLPSGRQLGGAPANFAYHAGSLGADTVLISRVGNDPPGREALQRLEKLGVPTRCIEVDPGLPTGTVDVELGTDGQPRYCIHEEVAWDALEGAPAGRAAVGSADAVCFGTLAQRSGISRATIRSLVAMTRPEALRVFDVNLRQNYYSQSGIEESLARANVLKMNESELPQIARMLGLRGEAPAQIEELARRHDLRSVAYTRGGNGSLLWADGRWSDHHGVTVDVVDSVGAGDSFTAALTMGLLSGWDLDRINEICNRVAAFVCLRSGGMPCLPENLKEAFC